MLCYLCRLPQTHATEKYVCTKAEGEEKGGEKKKEGEKEEERSGRQTGRQRSEASGRQVDKLVKTSKKKASVKLKEEEEDNMNR